MLAPNMLQTLYLLHEHHMAGEILMHASTPNAPEGSWLCAAWADLQTKHSTKADCYTSKPVSRHRTLIGA